MFKHAHGSKQNKVGQCSFGQIATKVKVSKKYILKTQARESSQGQLIPRRGWGKGARCVAHSLSRRGRGRGCIETWKKLVAFGSWTL